MARQKVQPRKAPAPRQTSASRALSAVDTTESQVVSQPSVRTMRLWTPKQLRAIELSVDSGDLYLLGDLIDQMLGDDRIQSLLETLAGSVLGAKLSFERNPYETVGQAEKGDEAREDWSVGYSEQSLTELIQWQQMTGIGFARHDHWVETDSGRVVPKLRPWHPKHFAYSQQLRSWQVRDDNGKLSPISAGLGEWVLFHRRGEFRPWSHGLWRGLARWWLLKQYAISDWGVHSEKAAKLVIEAGEGVSAKDRKELADELVQLAKDQVISLPLGFKLALVEATANTRDIYQAQIDAADMGFAITLLGQNLTSRIDGGSRAASETHERVENKRVRFVSKGLSYVLYTQSLPWWAEYNFNNRRLAPYPRYETEPPEDMGEKVGNLSTLATALSTLRTAGYRLTPEQIETEYGVKLEAIPDSEIPGNTITPNSGGSTPTRSGTGPSKTNKKEPPAGRGAPRLAGGGDPALPSGLVNSQLYSDDLAERTAARAAEALGPLVDRLLKAIDESEDYEGVRNGVMRAFVDEPDPERLRALVEHALELSQLAGHASVHEDATI